MIPKTLGACVDKLFALRASRQELQSKIDVLQEQEAEVREHLINNLSKADATGVRGRKATASIVRSTVAQAKDWDKFYAWVVKTKDFSLLQRRLNDKACRDMWEDHQEIPGVEPYHVVKVSLTKI